MTNSPTPTLLDLVRAAGESAGALAARDACRLGMTFDDWPGLEFAERQCENVSGLLFEEVSPDLCVELVDAYVDAYRTSYSSEWEESYADA